jgi:hypothetical protein
MVELLMKTDRAKARFPVLIYLQIPIFQHTIKLSDQIVVILVGLLLNTNIHVFIVCRKYNGLNALSRGSKLH